MKRSVLVIASLLLPLIVLGQNGDLLKDAQELFSAGNYSAAVTKFKEAVNKLSGKEQRIAQLQLGTAISCVEAINKAKTAASAKNYDIAIAEYQKVLDANPNDATVKSLQNAAQKAKEEANPTLWVSGTNLNFSSAGGTQKITVSCSMTWRIVDQTSSMCTVSRKGDEISIVCTSNASTSSRNTYFTIKTTNGVKEQRISISQTGNTYSSSYSKTSSEATYLTVSPTSINVKSTNGVVVIDVNTNASDYFVSSLPSWCEVKNKHKTQQRKWFFLSYDANINSSSRTGWFNVQAGGKTVRVNIKQEAKYSGYSGSSSYGGNTGSFYYPSRSVYKSGKLFRIGLDVRIDGFFLGSSYSGYYSGIGVGLHARIGRYDQLFNLIGGAHYVFDSKHQDVMVPVLLNVNILRTDELGGLAMYLGGGYEFGFSRDYVGDTMLQFGICGSHYDLSMFYKVSYEVLGLGFTYYF